MDLHLTKDDFEEARQTIHDLIHHTPLFSSRALGERAGLDVWLKAECLQKAGSFKPRGASNALRHLSPAEREKGVITASSGNHGQALSYVSGKEGIACQVVMPETANPGKVAAVRDYGGDPILYGDLWDEAYAHSLELAEERGLTYVHPFRHPHIMAGQGTCAMEIVEDLPDLEAILIPIGGGGLIGGMAQAIRAFKPGVRIIGVEPVGSPNMYDSRKAGEAVQLDAVDTIADGLETRITDPDVWQVVDEHVDEFVVVTDEEILEAIRFLLERAKLLAETAGAATTAALLTGKVSLPPGARTVAVVSGGNFDVQGKLSLGYELA